MWWGKPHPTTVQRAGDALGIIREKNAFHGGWQWRFPRSGNPIEHDPPEHAKSTCQVTKEENNLASWHLRKNQGKNGDSAHQVTEDAKLFYLGTMGANTPQPDVPADTDGQHKPARIVEGVL